MTVDENRLFDNDDSDAADEVEANKWLDGVRSPHTARSATTSYEVYGRVRRHVF